MALNRENGAVQCSLTQACRKRERYDEKWRSEQENNTICSIGGNHRETGAEQRRE